ncbi:MAG: hypothetical protein PHY40_01855 [Patescibacteria group bacterium]|nr:hypothetical protein [Patescibacteria group bacterium]
MQFPSNLNLKSANIFKIVGLALVAIVVIAFAFRMIGSSLGSIFSKNNTGGFTTYQSAPAFDSGGINYKESDNVSLSLRNASSPSDALIPTPISGETAAGDNAEEFEVTEYNAFIETRHLKNICDEIITLKTRDDVIFENANEYEKNCNYSFKVKRDSVDEILTIIKALDPKEFNVNTYTIKRLIDDYTGETEILNKKIKSIEETLTSATRAYDNIAALATKTQDVESLAKIIDSKINIIERLTQERININAQLERLGRAKAEQLDRLDYTYFSVNVLENKFVDWQNLKDSWKMAIKSFVSDINKVMQDITINLIAFLFFAIQYVIYLFVVLIIVKYGWKLAKYIWKK